MRRLVILLSLVLTVVSAASPCAQTLHRPLRSIHNSGNWGHNVWAVRHWEDGDRTRPLLPDDYIEYLKDTHVNWVGVSVALHIDDSMDSTVEREYSSDVLIPTFSDEALRQILREYREHGFNVYMTLAFEAHAARQAERPVRRWQLGDPGDPVSGVPIDHEECPECYPPIEPEFWPWRPDHPNHERFVREFWSTYTDQAVHFARIAQQESVAMYSLGTETERLFRTRSSDRHWRNDFGTELASMIDDVRSVYDGLLTYDMHYSAVIDVRDRLSGSPASDYLWEDLGLDVVGLSAWIGLVNEPPSTVMSVDSLSQLYGRIFRHYLVPLAGRNPSRPIVFLEYGAVDVPGSVANPADDDASGMEYVFSDMNGNGLDDGEETQANMFSALFDTMERYPGLLYGAFFWDNWIARNEDWRRSYGNQRHYSFRGKLAEEIVRVEYDRSRPRRLLPARTLHVGGDPVVVSVAAAIVDAVAYSASSSASNVATVTVSGSDVLVSPIAEGVAVITVVATGADGTTNRLQFTVAVERTDRPALEAVYRATGGDHWTNNTNWLTDGSLREWYGVEVGRSGRVTELRLGSWDESVRNFVGNGLVGTLPPELGDLAHLQRLLIEGNGELTGRIPAKLGDLTELRELYLGSNGLTGAVPAELGNLTNLRGLNLSGNALTGTIPASLANLTGLEWLSLWGDAWTSEPAPGWVGELINLRALDLGGHRFTGSIPATWRSLGNLQELFLWGNTLTGSIPTWFGSLTKLRTLNFNGNALTGPIPASLTNLSDLSRFDIAGTGVCVPDDPAIHAWLAAIADVRSSGLTCEGSPPVVVATLPHRTLAQDSTLDVDVSRSFADPDGDMLTYTVSSSTRQVVAARAAGAVVTLTAVGEGTATIRVTATDPGGLSATQTFTVTVTPPANRPPTPVGRLVPLTIGVEESPVTVEVSGAFQDPDGDPLTYGARTSAAQVASVSLSGSRVTVTPVSEGDALVTVTATDVNGSNTTATQSFTVTVGTREPFTDHPIVAGVTPLKAVHFTELRSRIDGVRVAAGLARFAWTDPVLRPGVTPVRVVHLLELRSALAAAYAGSGRSSPSWTDASPVARTTPIQAVHLMELRAALVALE